MKNKKVWSGIASILLIGILMSFFAIKPQEKQHEFQNTEKISTTVMKVQDGKMTVQDAKNGIYTINASETTAKVGDQIVIEYTGLLNKSAEIQKDMVITSTVMKEESQSGIPDGWQDNGIFRAYYNAAYKKLQDLTLDEKIGQLLLVRYPENGIENLKKYHFGGYVFFAKDFSSKTEEEVKKMTSSLQQATEIPILTAVDEEGGSVVRVSSNPNLVRAPFQSSQELYKKGEFDAIKTDTIEKSRILKNLGLNLNLAPVVDVSTDPKSYIYPRTLGQNTTLTKTYAKTVIEASKGTSVSYTLKHFPGYGNNADTHQGSANDTRTLENLKENDLPPFEAGIDAGAEAVLISHNTLSTIDSSNPASLSPSIHNILRNDLDFTGIIITDDLAMGATSTIEQATVKAILAGNDLIITTDYEKSIRDIKKALSDGILDEGMINKLAFRNLAWKYYKGLLFENEK